MDEVCFFPYGLDAFTTYGGCAALLYCVGHATCHMSESCVQHSGTSGPAMIYFEHNVTTADVVPHDNYLDSADRHESCVWAQGTDYPFVEETDGYYCTDTNVFDAPSCGL